MMMMAEHLTFIGRSHTAGRLYESIDEFEFCLTDDDNRLRSMKEQRFV